jgi:type IV pilus assembly protein PilB
MSQRRTPDEEIQDDDEVLPVSAVRPPPPPEDEWGSDSGFVTEEEQSLAPDALEIGVLPDDSSLIALSEMPAFEPAAARPAGRRKLQLGDMLIERKLIDPDQLEMALAEQRRTRGLLGDLLVGLGFVPEVTIAQIVGEQTGIPFVEVPREPISPQLLSLVPEEFARRHRLLPLGVEGSILRLAMANPFDVVALDHLHSTTGLVPFPSIGAWSDILAAIERSFSKRESFDETFESLITAAEARSVGEDKDEVTRGPLVELVDQLILRAVEERATDIHIEPEEQVLRVRYRVDSILHPGPMIPKKLQAGITARLKVMAGLNISESRLPQDGRIRFIIKGRQVDLRISTFLCNFGENVVLRVLDKTSVVLSLEKLGLLKDDQERFARIIERPHGIVLVTGPTGSGKTTTLYAALNTLNTIDVNIMTIEDPIEYELAMVRQSAVNVKAGITFASGLRALLRQDPDIILIGEMRDEETAQMAVRAAMTGHLVFSTLHTNTALGAIPRLSDMKVEPLLITDTVIAVIGQRLARMACSNCREMTPCPPHRMRELEIAAQREGMPFNGMVATVKGCVKCRFRGYHGRQALFEILEITKEVQEHILHKRQGEELMEAARSAGMRSMFEDGLRRVLLGQMTYEELDRVLEREPQRAS